MGSAVIGARTIDDGRRTMDRKRSAVGGRLSSVGLRLSASGWYRRALIGVVLAYVGILVALPIGSILVQSFSKGIGPFVQALVEPDVLHAFGLTLLLSILAVSTNTVFGVIVAWVLVRQQFAGRRFVNGLVDLPFVVSPVIGGYMILLLFGRQGWLAPLVAWTGIKVAFAVPGMFLATLFVSLPFVIREVMPVLETIGIEQEMAAQTLGASGWQTFWRVTLPSIRWGVMYGMSLTIARTLGEFGAVLVVGGAVAGLTETATLYIFRAMDERQYIGAYAASMVLAAVSFIILMAIEWRKRRQERLTNEH